jgi:hypothetical protein
MITNIGTLDRTLRISVAVLFSVLYVTGVVPGTAGVIILVLGGMLLVTAIVGTCGLYSLFGISTCALKK